MGRPLFSQAYTAPAVRLEPEQPQPFERWSIWNPFDPDSEEFFADAEVERICPAEEAQDSGARSTRSLSPVEGGAESASVSEASSSGRGTPTGDDDDLSAEELELAIRRRVSPARDRRAGTPDDGQTYRAAARPHTSYVRALHYDPPQRASPPSATTMPIPRAQVAPEPIVALPATPARSNPIPIPAPARPTTPTHGTPTYSYGSPSPPPSVTPRLYTWASRTPALPIAASPGSPLPNRGARMSFAHIASSSAPRVIF